MGTLSKAKSGKEDALHAIPEQRVTRRNQATKRDSDIPPIRKA